METGETAADGQSSALGASDLPPLNTHLVIIIIITVLSLKHYIPESSNYLSLHVLKMHILMREPRCS